jgi:curved DNA-binding protein CbpA
LSEDQVSSSLDKLAELKVVAFGPTDVLPPPRARQPTVPGIGAAEDMPPPRSRQPFALVDVAAPPPPAAPAAEAPRPPAAYAPVADDAPELDEAPDLDREVKKKILGIFPKIGVLDHYELLNVDRGADKKAIKRAYFEFAASFHPDKYFRKDLGSFKSKMETIFGRATVAHDTLSNKATRAEYDEYLGDLDKTRGLDSMLQAALADMEAAEAQANQVLAQPTVENVLARPQTGPAFVPSPPTAAQLAAVERARREALAARMRAGRTSGYPRGMSQAPASPAADMPKIDPGAALKRAYEDRVAAGRRLQVNKYVAMATEAEKKNDIVAAAHAYRVLLTVVGDDAPLRQRAEDGIHRADVAMAETYLRQAVYEERSESWGDAARSWSRVAQARPNDTRAHERAANAITRSNGDLHRAAELAQVAIGREPQNGAYRVTLANVYLAAGLTKNAKRELEAAAQLLPRDANIASLLKRVNKSE